MELLLELILEVILEVISEVIFQVNIAGAGGSPFSVFTRVFSTKIEAGLAGLRSFIRSFLI